MDTLNDIPPLPVGIHSAAVRAACPAHVFSPPANISWEVVDGRPTNTSIQGKLLTNERTPEFTLGANKGRCSFEYWLDDGPKARQDSKGKAFEAKLLNPIPSWPHSKAILSFQSSAGLGTSYEIKVDGVKRHAIETDEAFLELSNLNGGVHTIEAKASSGGETAIVKTSISVISAIDTHITGGPTRNYAFSFLNHRGPLIPTLNSSWTMESGRFIAMKCCRLAR